MNDIVPRETLSRQGVVGLTAMAGGVGLLLIAASTVLGFVVGGLLVLVGLSLSSRRKDRRPGLMITITGVLGVLSSAVGGFPVVIMRLSAAGLIIYGGLLIYRFIRGLKSRM